MTTKSKNIIRVAVLAAIMSWPGVETYRYFVATQAVVESQQNMAKVDQRLAQVRANQPASTVTKASLKLGQ